MALVHIMPATPFDAAKIGTFGKARYMLICQYRFPNFYNKKKEVVRTIDSDRISNFDTVCRKYGLHNLPRTDDPYLLKTLSHEIALRFIRELLHVQTETKWTGYRIMATSTGNGHTVWTFQLFAKNPASSTVVYTGEQNAPNVHA